LDKELKNELKRDEVGEALQEARGFFSRADFVKPALAVAGLILVLAGLYFGQRYRTNTAEAAFARASEVFHAEVGIELSAVPSTVTRYATSLEKFQKAKTMFDEVAKNYPSMAAGKRAKYYSALCLLEMKQPKEAEAGLREIAGLRDATAIEPSMARLRLAELLVEDGRTGDAATFYKALIDDPNERLPKDRLLFGYAEALTKGGKGLDGRRAYSELVNRHPQSPYASEARQRMDALVTL
jgi:predicted negative regulator of RcsB-dependent stress response